MNATFWSSLPMGPPRAVEPECPTAEVRDQEAGAHRLAEAGFGLYGAVVGEVLRAGTVTYLVCERVTPGADRALRPLAGATEEEPLDAMLRDAIRRHHGVEVVASGGQVAAAFSTAGDAVDAAREMLRASDRATVPPLRLLRIGLSTGEATEDDGTLVGLEVERAACLAELAHGA